MANMVPFNFDTPGIAGLNKQGRTAILGQEWATRAGNLVIDGEGRLAHRLGTKAINVDTDDTSTAIQTQFVGTNNSGTPTRYAGTADGTIWELDGSNMWQDVSGAGGLGGDGNYQFSMFNGKVLAWHADGAELVQSAPGANFANIGGTAKPGTAMYCGWGRVWVVDGDTLWYTDAVLVETAMTVYFELRHVWPEGHDVPVAITEFNGNLVVFGEHSIIIYSSPDDVANMVKADAIAGTGCINRDTVQNIGTDVLFLSHDGLKSLGRVIQEKSLPLSGVAPHMRDYIMTEYASSTAINVTSCFSERNGLYILSLQGTTIVVDTRLRLPDGGFRVTEWDTFQAVTEDYDGGLLLSRDDNANRAFKYQGILDDVLSDGTGGSSVLGDFESGWIDFSAAEAGMLLKFLKRIKLSVAGGSNATLQLKWYFDYSELPATVNATIAATATTAQYGIAQYSIDNYGTDVDVTELGKPGRKGGRVLKFGFSTVDSETALAINQISLYAKVGKQAN